MNQANITPKIIQPEEKHTKNKYYYMSGYHIEHFSAVIEPHLQYLQDRMTELTNKLVTETKILECQNRRLKRQLVINTASNNPMLAGELIGLPNCHRVEAVGNTAKIYQCKEKRAIFTTTNETECEIQPITRDHETISRDGWTLIPYHPCLWKNNVVNFNGVLMHWNKTDWNPITSYIDITTGPLLNEFGFEVDNLDQWIPKEHSVISEFAKNQLESLTDILGEMNSNTVNYGNKDFKQQTEQKENLSWLQKLKNIIKTTLIIITISMGIAAIIILVITYKTEIRTNFNRLPWVNNPIYTNRHNIPMEERPRTETVV